MTLSILRDLRLWALLLLLGVCIGSSAHCGVLLPQMPNPMATHFNGNGTPNGWSSPSEFAGLWLGLTWGFAVLFAGIAVWLPRASEGCVTNYVNLPGKQDIIRNGNLNPVLKTMSWMIAIDGAAIAALLWTIFALTAEANLSVPVVLPSGAIIGPVVGIIVFEIGFVATLFIVSNNARKAKPPTEGKADDQTASASGGDDSAGSSLIRSV